MSNRIAALVGPRLPGLLALAVLGGLAWWGHRTGWRAPALADLLGGGEDAPQEDWCGTHNVPASRCLACRPELAGGDPADWCREHGVPESKCTVCHPEILTSGKADDWCGEHGLPESQCTECHPEIAVRGGPAAPAPEIRVARDPAAPPAKDPRTCQTHALRVQFASAAAVAKAGVRVEAAAERPVTAAVAAPGEVEYDAGRVARLAPRAAGTLWRIGKGVGDAVRKGDVLALVDAAEAGRAKAELVQALAQAGVREATLARVRASADAGFRTAAEVQEAEAAFGEARVRVFTARQALANLGLAAPVEELARLPDEQRIERVRALGWPDGLAASPDAASAPAGLLPIVSPFDGVVALRDGVAGEAVDPARPVFVVVDPSRMWIVLDVRQEDAGLLASGQAVRFRPDGADEAAAGTVAWISTEVDEQTRTVRVRADAPNPDGVLRAHVFGTGRITVRETEQAVTVPEGAVHWEGCCHVVFVRQAEDLFLTRKVRPGVRAAGLTEIRGGLLAGEVVATEGSHVLKSEILKSRLGAGCVD